MYHLTAIFLLLPSVSVIPYYPSPLIALPDFLLPFKETQLFVHMVLTFYLIHVAYFYLRPKISTFTNKSTQRSHQPSQTVEKKYRRRRRNTQKTFNLWNQKWNRSFSPFAVCLNLKCDRRRFIPVIWYICIRIRWYSYSHFHIRPIKLCNRRRYTFIYMWL